MVEFNDHTPAQSMSFLHMQTFYRLGPANPTPNQTYRQDDLPDSASLIISDSSHQAGTVKVLTLRSARLA